MAVLKKFDRFAHEGILRDLKRVQNALRVRGNYEFGSSADGELTARRNGITSYTRKYRKKKGWRLEVCGGGKSLRLEYPSSFERVIEVITSFER